jgi:hypothetical protein
LPDVGRPSGNGGLILFTDATMAAIAVAHPNQLDHIARQVWAAHGSGVLDDTSAQGAAEAIRARQREAYAQPVPARKTAPRAAARRRQSSPDRQARLERRRRLAMSGPMPPHLAAKFTVGELSALRIIGDECREHGCCTLHIDAIAARAGVERSTVKNAVRLARRLGLLDMRERRRRGQRSLTNVIRVISAEWRLWLSRGGVKKLTTNRTVQKTQGFGATWRRYYRPYDLTERVVGPSRADAISSKKGA